MKFPRQSRFYYANYFHRPEVREEAINNNANLFPDQLNQLSTSQLDRYFSSKEVPNKRKVLQSNNVNLIKYLVENDKIEFDRCHHLINDLEVFKFIYSKSANLDYIDTMLIVSNCPLPIIRYLDEIGVDISHHSNIAALSKDINVLKFYIEKGYLPRNIEYPFIEWPEAFLYMINAGISYNILYIGIDLTILPLIFIGILLTRLGVNPKIFNKFSIPFIDSSTCFNSLKLMLTSIICNMVTIMAIKLLVWAIPFD